MVSAHTTSSSIMVSPIIKVMVDYCLKAQSVSPVVQSEKYIMPTESTSESKHLVKEIRILV